MKRKVVKHGPSTLIVSLPVKWAKRYGVGQGDELDVEEKGKKLLVSTETSKEPRSIEIDLTNTDRTSIVQQIRDLYRKGYSEIKVNFKKNKAHHFRTGKDVSVSLIIHEEVNRLIGMEVISQKTNFCVIKELTESSGKEFDNLLIKISFQLNDVFDDIVSTLEKKDFAELSIVEEKHGTITKFISYCIHLLNQGKVDKVEDLSQMYHLLISAEFVIDVIKYFSRSVISARHTFKKASVGVVKDIAELFEMYSRLQLKFEKERLMELPRKRNLIKNSLDDLVSRKENIPDMVFINYLASVIDVIKSMWEIKMSTLSVSEGSNMLQEPSGAAFD